MLTKPKKQSRHSGVTYYSENSFQSLEQDSSNTCLGLAVNVVFILRKEAKKKKKYSMQKKIGHLRKPNPFYIFIKIFRQTKVVGALQKSYCEDKSTVKCVKSKFFGSHAEWQSFCEMNEFSLVFYECHTHIAMVRFVG